MDFDMKKICYGVKRLITEYKNMHKPDRKTLIKDTFRIGGTAVAAGIVFKIVDTGFAALLGLIL